MSNLFFVHTPFQLFTAQQIIAQENLKDNIMCYGYVGSNKHFLHIYDAMKVPEFWKKEIFIDKIEEWSLFRFSAPVESVLRAFNIKRRVNQLINEENVDSVYFGDINNGCYQLLSFYYHRRGLSTCFYEEGSSHYVNTISQVMYDKAITRCFRTLFSDFLFYWPLWGKPFAKYLYMKKLDYSDLIITTRFSIRPGYAEPYDKRLTIREVESPTVKGIIDSVLNSIKGENYTLFLSEPLDINSKNCLKVEVEALRRSLETEDKNDTILIKFHPREDQTKRAAVISVFRELSIPYRVICEDINIPVEYFLTRIKFKKIVTYFCSTIFYNGYLYPNTNVVSLLPICYEIAKDLNDEIVIKSVEKLINSSMYSELFGHE